jgi:small-conductance mechanosensitive channel
VTHVLLNRDSGHQKAARSVEIIKDILSGIPDVNSVPDQPPRVYLSDFKEGALDILVIYVVKPADVWLFHEINERVNIEILKRFERECIAFAQPTEKVHIKKELP